MGFVIRQEEPPYFSISEFDGKGIQAMFTTRQGGLSRGPFASLNLGFHTGDSPVFVAANRRLLCRSMGISDGQLHTTNQVHGDRVLVIKERRGRGKREVIDADAQVTSLQGVALTCLVADCQAVYLYDPVHRVVGLAHAGWRGAVARVALKCVAKMAQEYGTDPKDCLAALSPAAGPCCYEVGEEVIEAVRSAFPADWRLLLNPVGSKKWKFDLWGANALVLHEAGLKGENITLSGLCTICRQDLFFSYRGSRGVTGRMAAIIMLE